MNVRDHNTVHNVGDDSDLERVLALRYANGFNNFWMTHGDEEMPAFAILVKNELAVANYFPNEGDPGFISLGDLDGLEKHGTTMFITVTKEKTHLGNQFIVPFSLALLATKEFFISTKVPKCIKWFEL